MTLCPLWIFQLFCLWNVDKNFSQNGKSNFVDTTVIPTYLWKALARARAKWLIPGSLSVPCVRHNKVLETLRCYWLHTYNFMSLPFVDCMSMVLLLGRVASFWNNYQLFDNAVVVDQVKKKTLFFGQKLLGYLYPLCALACLLLSNCPASIIALSSRLHHCYLLLNLSQLVSNGKSSEGLAARLKSRNSNSQDSCLAVLNNVLLLLTPAH